MAKSRTIYKTHVVRKGETLSKVANKYDVEIRDIKKWNNLSKNALKKGQRLKIKKLLQAPTPVPATAIASSRKTISTDTSTNNTIEKPKVTYEYVTQNVTKKHKVKRGENLSVIAAKYNVESSDIKKWNHLKSNKLMAGQALNIKTSETLKVAKKVKSKKTTDEIVEQKSEQVASNTTTESKDQQEVKSSTENTKANTEMVLVKVEKIKKYKVRKGDYLSTIAEKNKVSVQDLRTWNNMKKSIVIPGQILIIKKVEDKLVAKSTTSDKEENNTIAKKIPERNSDEQYVFHKVEKGDTLYGIAKKYAWMTVEKIKELNGLKAGDDLKAGMILKISKKG
jgi:membrane-bound lytic murein transglycosylase D